MAKVSLATADILVHRRANRRIFFRLYRCPTCPPTSSRPCCGPSSKHATVPRRCPPSPNSLARADALVRRSSRHFSCGAPRTSLASFASFAWLDFEGMCILRPQLVFVANGFSKDGVARPNLSSSTRSRAVTPMVCPPPWAHPPVALHVAWLCARCLCPSEDVETLQRRCAGCLATQNARG